MLVKKIFSDQEVLRRSLLSLLQKSRDHVSQLIHEPDQKQNVM